MEAFHWTARLGSVRAAAERLHLTQPSVSLRLREFERALGAPLFHKVGRRLHLTPRGAALRRQVEQIVAMAGEVEHSGAGGAPRLIRLGASDIFAMTTLAELLARIEASHPTLAFEVSVAFSHALTEMLQAGRLDLAFVTNPRPAAGCGLRRLAEVPVAWMAPPSLPLPDRRLHPADLESVAIFTNPAPSHLYTSIATWFAGAGITPRRLNTCNTLAVMAHLAAVRGGATVLPQAMMAIDPWAGQLCALDVTPEIPAHRMHAMWREDADAPEIGAVIAEAMALLAASPHYG